MNKKKKILLLSDDMRFPSGIAVMSKELVLGTIAQYDWIQLAAAVQHPDQGKIIDVSESVKNETGVQDASVKLYPFSGYGTPEALREIIAIEKPDAILHFTDPRYWGWLYQMESEIRQQMPLLYWTIWDDTPAPMWNKPFYESCDGLFCISKQTYSLVHAVLDGSNYAPWQITYLPHGINANLFKPLPEDDKILNEVRTGLLSSSKNKPEFIVFYNSRNIRRKHTSDLILAYKEFCDKLPKEEAAKCLLLLHTHPVDENGTDLPAVIEAMCPDYPIAFSSAQVSSEQLNALYNIADITCCISSNEGFGLSTAESVMAGTPIVVNVTGGLQDQCGFVDDKGNFLMPDIHYNINWMTNAEKTYTKCGVWAEPVFPAVRTLQGSPATPYIMDSIASPKDFAGAIMNMYNKGKIQRKKDGLEGRKYFMSDVSLLSSSNMSHEFIKQTETVFNEWKPRAKVELIKL